MQFLLAKRYYDNGYYSKAANEYRIYIKAYSEVASLARYPVNTATYKVGRAFYELGQNTPQADRLSSPRNYVESDL